MPKFFPSPAPSTAPRTHQWGYWWRKICRGVSTIEDTPHRIALGIAIGFFIGWLPIVGIQMVVAAACCWIFRGNVMASIPPVWISNPLTMAPMYFLENRLGAPIYGQPLTFDKMAHTWQRVGELGIWDGTIYLFTELLDVTIAMFIGGGIIGGICAVLVYLPTYRWVQRSQKKRAERREAWKQTLSP